MFRAPRSREGTDLLIVEDNLSQLLTLAALLQREGFRVVGCGSMAEAVEQLDGGEFAVAIVDLRLPDGDGSNLFETFQAKAHQTRIIVHTGFGSLESAKKALNHRVFAYVEKAGHPAELISEIHRAIEDYLGESLQATETRYRMLMESANDAIFVADAETGMLLDANQKAQELIGRSSEEIRQMHQSDLHPAEEREYYTEIFKQAVAQDGGFIGDLHVVHRDGHTIPIEISSSVITIDGKRLIQGIFRDLTEHRRSLQELQTSKRRLEEALDELTQTQHQVIQQERLRALGQMASGIAHDLNNSLSPVLGYAELMASAPDLPDHLREWLDCIQTGARDAAAVVERLREFYRPEPAGAIIEVVSLDDVLRQIPELTRPKWRDEAQRTGRSIAFELKVEDPVIVLGNSSELRELLTNLIFNAVDAMPSGGRITLSLDATAECAIVEVADSGVGMTEDVAGRCFEPFFTTKGTEGTGLGLSVCHGIIQRHGGQIEIDTRPGRGTTFRIVLPLAENSGSPELKEVKAPLPKHRLLYIDDDHRLREVVLTLLEQLGQQVDLADGGATGLEMVQTHDYDVVVTDLGMPEIDGREVTRIIRSIRPETPIIMVTGWGSHLSRVRIDAAVEPDQLVAKPVTLSKLRKALEKVFA